jgi:putative addiction module component (TIGR02574 family)
MATNSVQHVLEMARQLSSEERAQIADELLAGLEYPGQSVSAEAADVAWRDEARRRAERVLSGKTTGVAAEDVHADIESETTRRV